MGITPSENDPSLEYDAATLRLGRSSHSECRNGRMCVVKSQPRYASAVGMLASALVGGSLRFKNEIMVNECIAKEVFNSLRFPRMLESDGSTYAVFEFIEGREGLDKSAVSEGQVVDSLIELHMLRTKPRHALRERSLLRMLRLPVSFLRRTLDMFWRQRDIRVLVKCLLILIRSCVRQRPIGTSLLVHNDLLPNNTLTDANGVWFILDFENCLPENKWILIDVVDIAFDRETLQVDMTLVSRYLRRLQEFGVNTALVNVELQIRLILIYRVMQAMRSPRYVDTDRSRFSDFLKCVLLKDREFGLWLTRQEEQATCSS